MKDIFFKTLMLKGEAGGSIQKIEKTSSALNVDTYTIFYNDGETSTFEVTNGSSIQTIEKTATSGLQDTYTITLTNGDTFNFEVMNGEDAPSYELPAGSVVYFDSEDEIPEGYEASINPDGSRLDAIEGNVSDIQGELVTIGSDISDLNTGKQNKLSMGTVDANTDLDTVTTIGYYWLNSTYTHLPHSGSGAGLLEVIDIGNTIIIQRYTKFDANYQVVNIFERVKVASTWYSWKTVLTVS